MTENKASGPVGVGPLQWESRIALGMVLETSQDGAVAGKAAKTGPESLCLAPMVYTCNLPSIRNKSCQDE